MAKGTIIALFILTFFATLLIGINIGKKIGISQTNQQEISSVQGLTPTLSILSPALQETRNSQISTESASKETTSYIDQNCGVSIVYRGSYIKQDTTENSSTIILEKDNPKSAVFIACEKEIPEPPLPSDKIDDITIDGVLGKLYHDTNAQDGSPRDEAIFDHPSRDFEVIIAGFGDYFQSALNSLEFIE